MQSAPRKTKINDLIYSFFFLTRIIAFAFSTHYAFDDTNIYFNYATKILSGLTPYSQFSFEYPPLTLMPIYFSEIFFGKGSYEHYYLTFAFLMLLLDFCCLKICQSYCKNRLKMNGEEISYMVLLYSLFGLLMFRVLYHRLDIIVALFFAASLLFFQAKNSKLQPQFFANAVLGFFYKISPAFTAPVAIIFKAFGRANPLKKTIQNSLIFIASLAAIIFALELYTNHHFIANMLFHQQRGLQIESSFASILLFKNLLLQKTSPIFLDYGSMNIHTNAALEIFTKFFGNFAILSFYAALFFALLRQKNAGKKIKISEENFLDATLITILLCLAFQRVLSPQFFIWLMPVAAIWLVKNRLAKFLIVFCFLFLATFVVFSISHQALIDETPFIIVTLFFRNLVLVVFTLFLTQRFFKNLTKNDFK